MINLKINKILWSLILALSLVSAVAGAVAPGIYNKELAEKLLPATTAQDLLTIIVVAGALILVAKTKSTNVKKQIIILGIIGSLGYLYAIFSIEKVYTVFYLCYLAIIGLVLYALPISVYSITTANEKWSMPKWLKITSTTFSVFIAFLFTFLWVGALIPVMGTGQKIELYYSIYILDLAWIMPGFLITAIMSLRSKTAGLLMTPAMYILGIFVIFPLGLGELAKPFYGQVISINDMVMSFALSATFLLFAILNLIYLKPVRS
jgi:hypothetical protein